MKTLSQLNVYSTSSVVYTDESLGSGQVLANRYQINGLLDTDKPVLENIEKLCSAAGSWLSYDIHEGKWGVVINQSGTSIVSFNDSNVIGNISVSGTGLQDLYNTVKVEFPHRDLRDSADYINIEIPDGDRNANEEDNALNISYDIINDPVQANLLGFIELKQSRVDLVIRFITDFSYINLAAGDIIDITDSRFTFTSKKFRIIAITEVQDDDGALMMEITALEYADNIYSTADLYRYTRTDENGIITIGSIGIPGTPQVTKYEIDSRPRVIIESASPTGVVDGMEFWLSTDTNLPENQRSYVLIAIKRPADGGTFVNGSNIVLDYDNVSSGTFAVKTRGFNATTVGPYSTVSGLIAFTSTQVTNAIGPNTGVIDALGGIGTALGAYALLKGVDGLYQKIANTSSLFTKVFETFKDATGIDLIGEAEKGALNGLGIAKDGTLITNSATSINFIGDPVTLTDNGGGNIAVTISGTGGGSGYTGSVGYTGSQGNLGPIGYTGSRGTGGGDGTYQSSTLGLPSVYTVGSKFPPDRNTYQDPITGALSDFAPITGPYSIAFNTTLALPTLYNVTKVSGKNIYLYKSDGTLVDTVTSDNCELYTYTWGSYFSEAPGLQTNQASIRFTFNNRELGTDYYILMDEGILEYCNTLKSPAILSPDIWNFNTPSSPVPAYTVWATPTVGANTWVYTNSSTTTPTNTAVCSGVAPQIIVTWGQDRIATSTTSNVTLQLCRESSPFTVIETKTTTGQLINPRTMKIDSTVLTNLVPGNTYRIAIPTITNLRSALESANCGYNYTAANYGATNIRNLSIETDRTLEMTSYSVNCFPFTDPIAPDLWAVERVKVNKNTNIQLNFNRFVSLGSSGNFYIKNSDGSEYQTIPANSKFDTNKSSELVIASTLTYSTIILNPTRDFDDGRRYQVSFDTNAVVDACGNTSPYAPDYILTFTTDPGPISTATYSSQTITLNYDRIVGKRFGGSNLIPGAFCTGTFVIKNSSGVTVSTFTASTSSVALVGAGGITPSFTATISLSTIWSTLPSGTYTADINRGFLASYRLVNNMVDSSPLCSSQTSIVSFTK